MAIISEAATAPSAPAGWLGRLLDWKPFLVFICMLPAVGLLTVFLTYPLGLGFWLAFTDTKIGRAGRSEEHTSELQSLMRISYAVFRVQKKHHCTELGQLSRTRATPQHGTTLG